MPFETPTATRPREHHEPPPGHHYRAADGLWVPSVTTVLNVIAKDNLMEWSNHLGFQGIRYREHLDSLARAGTLTHAHIQAELTGTAAPDETSYSDRERRDAFSAMFHWRAWRKQYTFGRVLVEKPLVSEIHRYAGTLDAIIELDGQPVLLDWKTSKQVYLSHLMQVAAYQHLVRENWGRNLSVAVVVCPRVGGGYKEVRLEPNEELEELFDAFLQAKRLYDSLQRQKKHEKGLI